MNRSRPKEGKLQVLNIFSGPFNFIYKKKFLSINAKLTLKAYVCSPLFQLNLSHLECPDDKSGLPLVSY